MIIPTLSKAIIGYERVMNTWIDWHIQNQHSEEVEKWLEGATYLTTQTRYKIKKYQQRQQTRIRKSSQWQQIGRSYTQIENKKIHIVFVCIVLFAEYLITSSMNEHHVVPPIVHIDQLFTRRSAILAPLLAILWVHHYHRHNVHLRHLTTCFCGAVICIFLHRHIPFENHHDVISIVNVDTCIVAFGFWMSYPTFRSGKDIGGLCFLMAITTLFFPSLFWLCNIFCFICILAGVIIDLIHSLQFQRLDLTTTTSTNPH